MRKLAAVMLAVVACGVAALGLIGVIKRDRFAQTLGVAPVGPVAELKPGEEVCQRPIGLADDVHRVQFYPGTEVARPPAVAVTLRSLRRDQVLGRGTVPAGFDVTSAQTVRIGRVASGQQVELCFRNQGPGRIGIWGDVLSGALCTPGGGRVPSVACVPGRVRPTISTSGAFLHGQALPGDVAAVFLRDRPRSLLARVPLMMERASLFRPGFVTPTLWWVLLVAWLVLVPGSLAYALAHLRDRDSRGTGRSKVGDEPHRG